MIGLLMLAAAGDVQITAFMNGNALYAECQSQPYGHCLGYIVGISDAVGSLQATGNMRERICEPRDATQGQIKDVVVKWLADNPAPRAAEAGGLTITALQAAFPCPK